MTAFHVRKYIEAPTSITHFYPEFAVLLHERQHRLIDPAMFDDVEQQFTNRLEQQKALLLWEFEIFVPGFFKVHRESMTLHLLGQRIEGRVQSDILQLGWG